MGVDFTPFISKSYQIWDYFFLLIVLKDSKNLKSFDIGFWEVGAKIRLNRVNKWRRRKTKKNFLLWRFYTFYNEKISNLRPVLSIIFLQGFWISKKKLDIGLWKVGKKRPLSGVINTDTKQILLRRENLPKTKYFLCSDFTPFKSKSFKICYNFFSLLLPMDSESLKILDIQLQGVGA